MNGEGESMDGWSRRASGVTNAAAPSHIRGTENFLFLGEKAGVIRVKRRNRVGFPGGPCHRFFGFTMHRTS